MKQKYSLPNLCGMMRWLLPAMLGVAALTSCQDDGEVQPFAGPEYYPLEVGTYRVYDVADTLWRNNVPTASRFQFREQVDTELTPDATGEAVYRVIRSRRPTAADAWRVDSVFTVTVGQRAVTEQFSNRRTVALVFPVQEGKAWDINAFNDLNVLDSARIANQRLETLSRFYYRVGQPFSIERNGKLYSYDNSITTVNDILLKDKCTPTVRRTTFVKDIGPVYRVLRYHNHDTHTNNGCLEPILLGHSRSEVLIESGK